MKFVIKYKGRDVFVEKSSGTSGFPLYRYENGEHLPIEDIENIQRMLPDDEE